MAKIFGYSPLFIIVAWISFSLVGFFEIFWFILTISSSKFSPMNEEPPKMTISLNFCD